MEYNKADVEVTYFETEDVITTSVGGATGGDTGGDTSLNTAD